MGFSARLTKRGFTRREGGETEVIAPDGIFRLLRLWHWMLDGIDEDVTLGDLVTLLDDVEGIEHLSPMVSTDVRAILDEAKKQPTRDPNDRIEHVEVYNSAELTRYVPDPTRPDEPIEWLDEKEEEEYDRVEAAIADVTREARPLKIYDATGDDPITGEPKARRMRLGEQFGSWAGPYHISRQFHGWGRWDEPYEGYFAQNPTIDPGTYRGGWSVSLTPVQDLVHYPLRYNPELILRDDLYDGDILVQDGLTITIGEFIHAILWELGFYGSPDDRDEIAEELRARAAGLRDDAGDGA